MEDHPELGRTHLELVRQALKLAPAGVLATLVNASVLVAVLWQSISHWSLIIWFSITLCLTLQRTIFLLKFRPASISADQSAHVDRWFIAGTGLSGITWGCVAIFLFPVNSPTHQILIVFVLCGMVAGAAETFAPILPAFTAFALTALTPLAIRFLTIGGPVYIAMGCMTIFYIGLTSFIAIRINTVNRRLIEMKEHFAQTADERAIINARLQEEIAERGRMEDSLRDSEEQLRLLSSRLLSTQEDERKRIAGELHDSIGASLSAAKFSMENVIAQMQKGTPDPEPVNYSIRVIRMAIDEVRRIVMDLRPSILDDHGIIATINWLCDQFQKLHSHVFIERQIDIGEDEIPEHLKITILRIAQEAFHNISKYSGAERVKVLLIKVQDTIRLSIEDNGLGFDLQSIYASKQYRTGFGLMSMKERTELSGGSFVIHSEIGKGTLVESTWTPAC
ncbi:membrane hypothetical protein [Syntrophobacter sp. SbD1]|nr:membrane hypothetical protein [Syntrophobacter sp. SbD1]